MCKKIPQKRAGLTPTPKPTPPCFEPEVVPLIPKKHLLTRVRRAKGAKKRVGGGASCLLGTRELLGGLGNIKLDAGRKDAPRICKSSKDCGGLE